MNTFKDEQHTDSPTNARQSLRSITYVQNIARKHSAPPQWFILIFSTLFGLIVALAIAEFSRWYLFPLFILMLLSYVYTVRKSGVVIRPHSSRRRTLILLLCSIALSCVIILFAIPFYHRYGLPFIFFSGATISFLVYILFHVEKQHLSKRTTHSR